MYSNWYKKSNKLYGYWIPPEGKAIPVNIYQGHSKKIKDIALSEENNYFNENDDPLDIKYDYLSKGWITIAFDFGDMFITSKTKPTHSQLNIINKIIISKLYDIKNIHVDTFKDSVGKKIPIANYKMVISYLKGQNISKLLEFKGASKLSKSASKVDDFISNSKSKYIKNYSQKGELSELYDVQRYVMDSYSIKVNISKTKYKLTVYIMANHALLGSVAFHKYWSFDLKEDNKAIDTYKKVCHIVGETIDDFVSNETPTSIFWPTLKAKLDKLNPDDIISSNIPHVNYQRYYNNLAEPDWRKNIYGDRYPTYNEESYKQKAKRKGVFFD